ncbi:hypothetical protein AVEN_28411-1 [Araneus ventricosus]|uniref:Uncharacterized protein n=1 Tax=Araneus ventricosus TaxID=182803 RepID=A0A4Y2QX38_ARAVE|nr:hypothetical protein AVEN_127233-1 [Araneus ventricosus]GBN67786.1 hypothetical protein AVEN_28411-1 [Araneus ventricosus]
MLFKSFEKISHDFVSGILYHEVANQCPNELKFCMVWLTDMKQGIKFWGLFFDCSLNQHCNERFRNELFVAVELAAGRFPGFSSTRTEIWVISL